MKKLLAIVAIATLAACGGASTTATTDSTAVVVDSTVATVDSTVATVDSTLVDTVVTPVVDITVTK